jgi:hypothetical protein
MYLLHARYAVLCTLIAPTWEVRVSPLSRNLFGVLLTRECPYCGHPVTREGSWFYSIQKYKCAACMREVPITYSDKMRLFVKQIPPISGGE